MNKRKQASSAKPHGKRGPATPSKGRARNVARVTKSKSSSGTRKRSAAQAAQPVSTTLTLAAECLVSRAATLKEELGALVEEPQTVTLDVSSLQRIDTAGLQVITAFVRERATHGRAIAWHGTAPVLVTAAQLLGLTSLLGLPA